MKTGDREQIWKKNAYPEEWAHMYGMTHNQLQFNYLPDQLIPYLAPTDTRFRPDQRALENGDFKLAETEKNRVEEKQRAVRKYNESNQIEPEPHYFEKWSNPDDSSQTYYLYNGLYFEKDRIENYWGRLPDLYGESLSPHIKEFIQQ